MLQINYNKLVKLLLQKKCLGIVGVVLLLIVMAVFLSIISAETGFVYDEAPHITAGYTYLTLQDFRLNPEHPPLIKLLAALPLTYLDLNFYTDSPAWLAEYQWQVARNFLFKWGNNPDQILLLARIPQIIITLALGVLIFIWAKRLGGSKAGLLALFLYVFNTGFLGHGALVTTDVPASFFILGALYLYVRYLESRKLRWFFAAAIFTGLSFLVKYSTLALVPAFLFYYILLVLYKRTKALSAIKEFFALIVASAVSYLVIYLLISGFQSPVNNILQGFEYLLSYLIKGSESTVYILDGVYLGRVWFYFPVLFIAKTQLSLLILFLYLFLSLLVLFAQKSVTKGVNNFNDLLLMVTFCFVYFAIAFSSSLQLGYRHLLPIFPPLIIMSAYFVVSQIKSKLGYSFLAGIMIVYVYECLITGTAQLSYVNALGGGTDNGYKLAVDSNYDWGQDINKLKSWVEKQNIEVLYVDYFGSADPQYYLGDRFKPWYGSSWWSESGLQTTGEFPKGNFLAISVTFLQNGRYTDDSDISGEYSWLNSYTPVDRVGKSIFIYYID